MKKLIVYISLCLSLVGFGQEHAEKEFSLQISKVSYLDSLKATFINHSTSTCIDERWIAELANISPGTVDRIIHKRGQVAQETVDKVNAIIEEFGYKRNILASNLALNKKFHFAVFFCLKIF